MSGVARDRDESRTSPIPVTASAEAVAARAKAKAFWRVNAFLILCYLVSYLDRTNIGFANLTMAKDLGLTATIFGLANSAFYVAYAGFEIPSNMALARFGARRWISRIMITWGLASGATLFAIGPKSLYFVRFLVGAAEAGLLPGIILYLSAWFSAQDRARANSVFVMGMPLALVIGGPISGLILQMDGALGLAGWKWLFLVEALPSVVLGIAIYLWMADRPTGAKWLTPEEGQALEAGLAGEDPPERAHRAFRWGDLVNPTITLLAVLYFCMMANNNTLNTWTPLVVKDLLGGTNRVLLVGLVSAIAPLVTLVAIPIWSWSSDRRNERRTHLLCSMALAGLGWTIMALASSALIKLVGLTLASVGGFTFVTVFWAMAVPLLPPASRPTTIALISTVGLLASILSPTIVGVLRDLTHSFKAAFWYVAALNGVGVAVIALGALRAPKAPATSLAV